MPYRHKIREMRISCDMWPKNPILNANFQVDKVWSEIRLDFWFQKQIFRRGSCHKAGLLVAAAACAGMLQLLQLLGACGQGIKQGQLYWLRLNATIKLNI